MTSIKDFSRVVFSFIDSSDLSCSGLGGSIEVLTEPASSVVVADVSPCSNGHSSPKTRYMSFRHDLSNAYIQQYVVTTIKERTTPIGQRSQPVLLVVHS